MVNEGDIIAVWFSNGAASAVALQETLLRYGNICTVRAVNNPVIEEDEDNIRFRADVEKWLGIQIETAINENYPAASAVEVWDRRKGMSFPKGAPCTVELKKEARYQWEKRNKCDWHVLGFTAEEKHRFDNFVLGERSNLLPVLIEKGITKEDCYQRIRDAGIALPRLYSEGSRFGSGYPNANCIGCVKATSATYWNHVRETRPEIFQQRAEQSRRLGSKLVRPPKNGGKRIFLDELHPDTKGRPMTTMKIECGIFCEETP